MKDVQSVDFHTLKEITKRLRIDVMDMTTRYGGHPSSCFSATELVTVLFFGGVLRYRSNEPDWPERDRFILSKGHAAPLLYAVLAQAGYIDHEELRRFRELNSPLHGHPIQNTLPGVEVTSGSLGQGLSFGLGHVLASRLSKLDYRVYVLLGDGECEEGQIWEAAMAAAHYKADHLTAIVDYNKNQQTGPVSREMELEPFADKWLSFGWHVDECEGHDMEQIINKLAAVQKVQRQPSVLIAHTVKGKGVSFIEGEYATHGKPLTPEQNKKARKDILCN